MCPGLAFAAQGQQSVLAFRIYRLPFRSLCGDSSHGHGLARGHDVCVGVARVRVCVRVLVCVWVGVRACVRACMCVCVRARA